MPRFVLERIVVTPVTRERLSRLAAERFPEIDIEDQRSDGRDAERWVCRSTSAAQLLDWLALAGVDDVRIAGTALDPAYRDRR